MAFCKNCGANLPEGATFCSSCGTPVNDTAQQNQQPNFTQSVNSGDADVRDNKVMAILAYLGILVLIPIFAAKDSKFARYHASQGTTLCIFGIAYAIAYAIINGILFAIIPWRLFFIYTVVSGILSFASVFFLVLAIVGIVNACQGQCKELPLIGKIDILGKFMK